MFSSKKAKAEISYTAGRLGQKIGVCRDTVKKKLRDTGLINDCYKDKNGWLQIPYSVAVKLASEAALAVESNRSTSKKRKPKKDEELDLVEMGLMPPKTQEDYFPKKKNPVHKEVEEKFQARMQYCRNLACLMQKMGITPKRYMEAYRQAQKGEAADNESLPEEG